MTSDFFDSINLNSRGYFLSNNKLICRESLNMPFKYACTFVLKKSRQLKVNLVLFNIVAGLCHWAVKKAQEKKLDVAEMRMLRWISGVTKLDRIRNVRIRGTTKVGEISRKVQESRLKWYGHVLRREEEYVGKRVMAMEVPGKRRRGRPKRRWMDTIGNDLSEKELSREDTQDRAKWRSLIRHIDPT